MDTTIILKWMLYGIIGGAIYGVITGFLSAGKKKLEEEKLKLQKQQMLHLQAQLQQLQMAQIMQAPKVTSLPPPPGQRRVLPMHVYRIARNGEDLGEMSVSSINQLIRDCQLSMEDFYFDVEANDWLTLHCLPELT